ncbi:MAG: alpha-L-fucosidase [Gemmatimonadota bacterium]
MSATELPRRDFIALAAVAALGHPFRFRSPLLRPRPSASQLLWQRDELALFTHFGVNTFSDREWGDGKELPASFNPPALDARQWTSAAKAAGFRTVVLTAKHHDGFCLWPTATTKHSVAASPFRNGAGDVVREVADACRADGLRLGLYLSPWDRNSPVYGTELYSDFYCDQLSELLTRYGPVHEVWFDGANGEGPTGRRQLYDWPRYWGLVRTLQPDAVIFSDAGPDVRWIGNESGSAGETNWSTVDPSVVPVPGSDGPEVIRMLQEGDPDGTVWRPGETDTSIRPGWFYHPADDDKVRTVDDLVSLYFSSVGRNSKLLLNVPPTREGLLHPTDVARLAGMRGALDRLFGHPLVPTRAAPGHVGATRLTVQHDFRRPTPVGLALLAEDIAQGQVVAHWRLEGQANDGWLPLASGTTIGHKRIVRFPTATLRRVRLVVAESVASGPPPMLQLFAG